MKSLFSNIRFVLFCLLMTTAKFSFAAEPKSLHALSTNFNESIFRINLRDGHHFNYKAPNHLRIDEAQSQPTMKNPKRMEFRLKKDQKWKKAFAEVYVCDDPVTYCETLRIPVVTATKVVLVSE